MDRLKAAQLKHQDRLKTDFSQATRYSIDPKTNKIKKAKFSFPEVVGLLNGFDITIVNHGDESS
ncbi:MAG: hypothetical protein WCF65_06385 [Parachlamydiaceae bacterium]